MLLLDTLIALLIALVLTSLLLLVRGRQFGYRGGSRATVAVFLFLILFFATWAGGLWITPFGPSLWGAYWLPFLAVGSFVALLLMTVANPSRRGYSHQTTEPGGAESAAAAMAFGVLYWLLMIALATAIVAGYTPHWFRDPAVRNPVPQSGRGID